MTKLKQADQLESLQHPMGKKKIATTVRQNLSVSMTEMTAAEKYGRKVTNKVHKNKQTRGQQDFMIAAESGQIAPAGRSSSWMRPLGLAMAMEA